MFDRIVNAYIARVVSEQAQQDDKEIPLVTMRVEVPLTPTLAGDLGDFVKRSLYTAKDGEVNGLMKSAVFDIGLPPQAVEFRMAVDQTKDSFTLPECLVSTLKAVKRKKTNTWTLIFTLTAAWQSAAQLQQIMTCHCQSRYLTFETAVADLFDEERTQLRRGGRRLTAAEVDAMDEDDEDEDDDAEGDGAAAH